MSSCVGCLMRTCPIHSMDIWRLMCGCWIHSNTVHVNFDFISVTVCFCFLTKIVSKEFLTMNEKAKNKDNSDNMNYNKTQCLQNKLKKNNANNKYSFSFRVCLSCLIRMQNIKMCAASIRIDPGPKAKPATATMFV